MFPSYLPMSILLIGALSLGLGLLLAGFRRKTGTADWIKHWAMAWVFSGISSVCAAASLASLSGAPPPVYPDWPIAQLLLMAASAAVGIAEPVFLFAATAGLTRRFAWLHAHINRLLLAAAIPATLTLLTVLNLMPWNPGLLWTLLPRFILTPSLAVSFSVVFLVAHPSGRTWPGRLVALGALLYGLPIIAHATYKIFGTPHLQTTFFLTIASAVAGQVAVFAGLTLIALDEAFNERRRSEQIWTEASEAMRLTSRDGTILKANEAFSKLVRMPLSELVGRSMFDCYAGSQLEWLRAEYIRRTASPDALLRYEGPMELRNGEQIYVTVSSSWMDTPDGPVILSMFRDDTQRRASEIESQRLQGELEHSRRMEAIGRLAGGVAHDFNNLLTVINGYADLILDSGAGAETVRRQVELIRQAGSRASEITTRLLQFSRRKAGDVRLVDLNSVLREDERILTWLAGAGIEIRWRLLGEPLEVLADKSEMVQIVLNLVTNARDAMRDGGTITIETSASNADSVLIAVSDTGHGMDEETRRRATEPFFTTKPQGEGTGLGLATVYGITQRYGGDLQILSQPGHGTRVEVKLPRGPQFRKLPGPR